MKRTGFRDEGEHRFRDEAERFQADHGIAFGLSPYSSLSQRRWTTHWRVADSILDRLVHNAHRIEMRGDSMRKNRTKAPLTPPTQ